MHAVELIHPELPELVDEVLRREGWSWESVARGERKFGEQTATLEGLAWELVNADPVLWGECNLVNRIEDGGGLWKFFDYQKTSLRLRSHVVHQDGAEVGKSREIVCLILWGTTAEERGSVLCGSCLDGDLDEIWEEIEHNRSVNKYLGKRVVRSSTKPYRRLTFDNGLMAIFRPAGHDGRAYRGIHVRGFLLHDEAAKVTNPRSWSEFWRAAKPGCKVRIYSVPTGDQLCTFQRIANNAIPAERVTTDLTTPSGIVDSIARGPAIPDGVKKLSRELGGRVWIKFHWPKTLMPAPFWSEERRRELSEFYGGPDEPGYIHNVLGLPGDPAFSVFPLRLLQPALAYIPEFRHITLRWDNRSGRVDVKVSKLNPSYSEVPEEAELEVTGEAAEDDGVEATLVCYRDSLDVEGFTAWPPDRRRAFIDDLVGATVQPLTGVLTVGVDVASSTVTEINVERTANGQDTWLLRLSLHGWDWYSQADLVRSLDEVLMRPQGGWGFDATGAGKVLVDLLVGTGDELSPRVSGYVFNIHVPAINPDDGEPLVDPMTGRQITLSHKEQATQLLERALAAHRKRIPNDPELIFLLQNHTYMDSGGGRRYSKENDHVVDSWRCLALRLLTLSYGIRVEAPVTFVVPPNNEIDSMAILSRL